MFRSVKGWLAGSLVAMSILAGFVDAATVYVDTGTGRGNVAATFDVTVESGLDGKTLFRGEGIRLLGEAGQPGLPWGTVTILLPPNADPTSVTCIVKGASYEAVEGTWAVDPLGPPTTWDRDGKPIVRWPAGVDIANGRDMGVYGVNAFWPTEQVRVLSTGQMRKWQVAKIGLPLVAYNPVSGELSKLSQINIAVSYRRTRLTPAQDAEARRPDPAGRARAKRVALNFNLDAGAYPDGGDKAAAQASAGPTAAPMGLGSTGYCIIATDAFRTSSTQLNDFVTLKQNQGYTVYTPAESAWGGGTGDTAANNIRTWLRNNYVSSDIKYVLFIGDPTPTTSAIPMKMVESATGTPTDFFFADLTGVDWDKDNDGISGEDPDDMGVTTNGGVDGLWEVIVGRIPHYGNMTETDAILQKIVSYETSATTAWRRNVLLPMNSSDTGTPGFYLGEQIKDNLLNPAALPCYRIYNEIYTASSPPDRSPLSTPAVTNAWSTTPYGLVLWWAHGGSTGAGDIMDTGYVPYLNDGYPSATFQCSCDNGYPEEPNNLGYSILRHGGINTISASRLSWYAPGQTSYPGTASNAGMTYEYGNRIVQGMTTGEALMDMKQDLMGQGWWSNFTVFNMYGDPGTAIFPPAPTELTVTPLDPWYKDAGAGTFTTSSRAYTLKNPYASSMSWTASKTASWLTLSPTSGSIAAGGTATVTVSLSTAAANALLEGRYTDTVTFRDTTHSRDVLRTVMLDVQPQSMPLYYKMDDASGTLATDSSGFCRTGTLNGGLAFGTNSVAGHFGNALNFDGVDDYITVPDLKMRRNSITFTAWIKRNGAQSAYSALMFARSTPTVAGLHFGESNELRYTWNGGNYDWSSGLTIPDNTWVFVALVVTPTNATIYRYNGSMSSAVHTATHPLQFFAGNDSPYQTNALFLGLDPIMEGDPPHYVPRFFKGAMDDVRIYDYALDATAIQAVCNNGWKAMNAKPAEGSATVPANANLYWTPAVSATQHDVYFGTNATNVLNATTASAEYKGRQTATSHDPSLAAGTTYYWRIDEVAGTTVTKGDVWSFTTTATAVESGVIFHGTMDNADISGTTLYNRAPGYPQYNATIWNGPTTGAGPINEGLYLDWWDDYVTVPAMNLNSSTVTLTAWVYSNAPQWGFTGILFCRENNSCLGLNFGDANELRYHWNGDGATYGRNSNMIVPNGQWVFTAMVVEPLQATLYLGTGGPVKYWTNWLWHDPEEFDGTTWIAWDPCTWDRILNGNVDDVGIWNRALTGPEIQALYDAGARGCSFSNNDTAAPTPNPMTWATAPYATGSISIAMVATTASDSSGVEYYFDCTAGAGGHDSGWQSSPSYTDTGLTPGTQYTYTVKARDKSFNQNEGTASAPASATTTGGPVTYYPGSYVMNQGTFVSGSLPSSVQTNNNVYFVVASTTSGTTRYATTDFTVTGISATSPAQISVQLISKSSRSSTTQRIYLWNYTTSAWDQKDSITTLSTSEVTRSFNVTTGTSSYISGGQLKVRTYSSHGSSLSFNLSHEVLSVTVTP